MYNNLSIVRVLLCSIFSLPLVLEPSRAIAQRQIQEGSSPLKAVIGQGYSSQQQTFTGICLAPTKQSETLSGAQTATLNFDQSLSQSDVSNQLGFSANTRARFGMIEASAEAEFQSESTSSSTSLTSVYWADYHFKSVVLDQFSRTKVGESVADNYEHWAITCGDEAVTQVDYGAKLYYMIRLDFASSSDRSAFSANFNITGPLFSAGGTMQTAQQTFGKNVRVTIGALQLGGDITQLSRIFGGSGSTDGTAFVSCTLGDFDKCSAVLQQAIDYARTDFSSQLKDHPDPTTPAGPAVLDWVTQPYNVIGEYHQDFPMLTQAVNAARQELSDRFETDLALNLGAERLLSGRVLRLSSNQTGALQILQDDSSADLQLLLGAAQVCYEGKLADCPSTVSGVLSKQRSLSASSLDIKPENFAQFCDLGYSGKGDLLTTINAVLTIAETARPEVFATSSTPGFDLCGASEPVVEQLPAMNLSVKGISDLRPLAFANALNNLSLQGNSISDVTPLAHLTNLQFLDLGNNNIADSSPLSGLTNLQTLVLINNKDNLKCPLQDSKRCEMGNYGDVNAFHALPDLAAPMSSPCQVVTKEGVFLIQIVDQEANVFSYNLATHNLSTLLVAQKQDPLTTPPVSMWCSAVLLSSGKIFVVGASAQFTFDPQSKMLTQVALAQSLAKLANTSVRTPISLLRDGRVIIFGEKGVIFNPDTASVTILGDGWGTGSIAPRVGPTATILKNGDVLLTGGETGGSFGFNGISSSIAELFHADSGQTELLGTLTEPRYLHQATLLDDGRVLISGGFRAVQNAAGKYYYNALASAEIYDPTTRTFTITRGTLSTGRWSHTSTVLSDGRVLVAGGVPSCLKCVESAPGVSMGYMPINALETAEVFDPTSGIFYPLGAKMVNPRANDSAFAADDSTVIIFGGSNLYNGAGIRPTSFPRNNGEVYTYKASLIDHELKWSVSSLGRKLDSSNTDGRKGGKQ